MRQEKHHLKEACASEEEMQKDQRGYGEDIQSNGCCFDPAMVEHFLTMGATQALQQHAFYSLRNQQSIWLSASARANRSERRAGAEEKEAWEEDWDDERTANGWYESAAFGSAVDPAGSDAVGELWRRKKSQHAKKWNTRL